MPKADFAFWRLWTANVLNLFSAGAWIVAFPIVALTNSYPPSVVGGVTTAYLIGTITALIGGGFFIDVLSKSNVMAMSSGISAICYMVAAFSIGWLFENLPVFLAVSFVLGLADALYGPASEAIVPEVVNDSSLVRANSLISMAESLAAKLVGPALAGLAVVVFGEQLLFAALAMCCVGAMALCLTLNVSNSQRSDENLEHQWVQGTLAGIRVIFACTWLKWGLLWSAIALLFQYGARVVLMPFWFQQHDDPAGYALSISALGVGALLSGLCMSRIGGRFESFTALMILWLVGSLCWLPIAFAFDTRVAVFIMFFMGFFNAAGNIIWSSLLQSDVPESYRGRVASADWLVSISLMPVSAAVTGLIARSLMIEWIAVAAVVPAFLGLVAIARNRVLQERVNTMV
ncbi:MFS transporter [Corynebacterium hindlerae]|uniref:MFS transporter n=1 Tax=Corynebacterium hindlerae TaxID=699041 RepID=UPI0031B6C0BF